MLKRVKPDSDEVIVDPHGTISAEEMIPVLQSEIRRARDGETTVGDNIATIKRAINNYEVVLPVNNTFTLDLSKCTTFLVDMNTTDSKTFAIINAPTKSNISITITIVLKYSLGVGITYPAGCVWRDGFTPYMEVGKQYMIVLTSFDNGQTYLASSGGAW